MAPLEPWEKVLVSAEFTATTHGQMACSDCHGGQQSADMATAHTDLVIRPSESDTATCGNCHPQEVAVAGSSLLAGGNQDGDIVLWSVLTGEKLRTFSGHAGLVLRLAFNHDGTRLA